MPHSSHGSNRYARMAAVASAGSAQSSLQRKGHQPAGKQAKQRQRAINARHIQLRLTGAGQPGPCSACPPSACQLQQTPCMPHLVSAMWQSFLARDTCCAHAATHAAHVPQVVAQCAKQPSGRHPSTHTTRKERCIAAHSRCPAVLLAKPRSHGVVRDASVTVTISRSRQYVNQYWADALRLDPSSTRRFITRSILWSSQLPLVAVMPGPSSCPVCCPAEAC